MDKSARARLGITFIFFCIAFVLIVFSIFYECKQLALNQAENNLAAFLLNHRATRNYVEYVQKPEVYRLKRNNQLYNEYFSPKLLSGTYITRHINELQNEDRQKAGLEEIYFKFASPTPRNPVNQADPSELELLGAFNKGTLKEYKETVRVGDETFLYYAIPIDRNSAVCMLCHGDPADAPQEMLDMYGDQAGFHEKLGELRALMSVRVPVSHLLSKANQTATLLSVITFCLLSGAYLVVYLLFREVEKQKKIALHNSYYLNSVLQSSSSTAIVATDGGYNIKYFNNAAERIFQLSASEVLESSILDVANRIGLSPSGHVDKAISILQERGVFMFQFEFDHKTIEAQISKISGPEHDYAGFLFMGQDVTARIMEEKESEEIKNRLVKAEKMESIGLLAGGVAHDLNNILSGIINYPELLLMKLPEDSPLRPTMSAIQQSGQRAAAVVADLLMVARGVASKKEAKDLNQLVADYLESPEYEKLRMHHLTVTTTAKLAAGQLPVYCSPIHIKKCVMNLVGNALEAVEQDGLCEISTGSCSFDLHSACKYNLEQGDYCFVQVRDSGPGIAEKDIHHIFEPFYSSKKMGRSGTGLGLSIVWNTVKDHKGAVDVESDTNGSRFTLYFPVYLDKRLEGEDADSTGEMLLGQQEKILIVDDEPQLQDIAKQMLMELNYEVFTVGSGEDAIQFLKNNTVDLVLIDMIMAPGMNGRETYQEVVALHPGQKALIVSGFSESSEVKAALEMGARGFISKPYSLDQLGRIVKTALQD